MKVALLTNTTADVSYPVFKRLNAADEIDFVHTFFYDTVAESRGNPLKTIAKFGVRGVIVKAAGLVASKARSMFGGAEASTTAYEHAVATDLPHTVVTDINDPIHREMIAELDVLVVCNCKNILKKSLLLIPGVRFINLHSSLLPEYRGPAPIFWAMYHGESQTGMTIHEMTPKIDRGTILAQKAVPLDYSKSVDDIAMELYTMSADMLMSTLVEGSTFVANDDAGRGSYYTFPTPAERREFKRRMANHVAGGVATDLNDPGGSKSSGSS